MIQSMTGFGKSIIELPNRKITIEIKSLNSKQLDLSCRIPSMYREVEMEIRSEIAKRLERGKVDFSILIESVTNDNGIQINANTIANYQSQILKIADDMGMNVPQNLMEIILRMPDVIKTERIENTTLEPEEKIALMQVVQEAIDHLIAFRQQEGEMLRALFTQKIANISTLLSETTPFEAERVDKIKTRILEAFNKIEGADYDKNRLEQEMIYYIEKLDINEEKDRLGHHLIYFIETLEEGKGQGKKLGFICQEIGREINTLGSKSNHNDLQRIVVKMKDELEQIKEQVLNVL